MNEAQFHALVEEMVRWFLEQSPVLATYMGVHEYDHLLADCRIPAIEARHERIRESLADLQKADPAGWSKESRIDYTLVVQLLKKFILEHEQQAAHLRDPAGYLFEVMEGVFSLIIKEFAPLEQRLQSLAGRVGEVPRVLAEGKSNLQPAKVPPVWGELALEQARMGPALFEGLLPAIAAGFPKLQAELAKLGREAAAACVEYASYLEKELLPAAAGDFAAGEDYFNTLLREQHLVDYDAAALLETGRRLFNETRSAMEDLARQIDPSLTIEEILERNKENHPAADDLLSEYRRAMEAARSYTVEHNIASLPAGETLRIIETPQFLRPIIPYAAYMPSGIFEEKLEGIFMVTPPDENASPEEIEAKLKGQPYSKIPVTAIHEAYPGHHLQLSWAASRGSTARKMGAQLSTLFVEGWAFYCEELMEQLGYINTPLQRLGRLSDQLWRAARIILDVSLHCRGMSVAEAVNFLVKECGLQPADALAEVRRYTVTPTQPQSYLMGKLEILKIIDEYKKLWPGASLRQMHDDILACGSLPPQLMRRQLFSS